MKFNKPETKYEEVYGDLIDLALQGKFDVIIHGCNCFHKMGSGLAPKIRAVFPCAWQADLQTEFGSKDKLGTISYGIYKGDHSNIYVVNCYSQYKPGKNLDYDALTFALESVNHTFMGSHIGIPLIGCGIAGGAWGRVKRIIKKELWGCDKTIVKFVEK